MTNVLKPHPDGGKAWADVICQIERSNLDAGLKEKMIKAILDSRPLDVALGLRHRNSRTARTREMTQRRDTLLQKIATEYTVCSPWAQACILADEIAKFPATRHRKTFEYMLAEGMRLPSSPERIYQILRIF